MKVITISNQKGGVGKTTIAFHLAHYLWKQGHFVLAIDIDPQGNLTSTLTEELDDDTWSAAHVKGIFESGIAYPIEIKERLMLIPSDIRLAVIETQTSLTNYYKLKRFIEKLDIDYVVIDTPPNLGLFTINALLAATHIVIPIQPSRYAQIALETLIATVKGIKETSGGSGGEIAGVVITRAKTNTRMYQETVKWLKTEHPGLLIEPAIPDTVKVQYSIREQTPVFEKYPRDRIAQIFEDLCKNTKEAIHG